MNNGDKPARVISIETIVENDIGPIEERVRLAAALKLFVRKMSRKLEAKVDDGWYGWCENENVDDIFTKLLNNVSRGDFVDVANLAMFLERLNYSPPLKKAPDAE